MSARSWNDMAVAVPKIYLPVAQDLRKYCVIACDQYTSDMAYWQRVEQYVGDAPSTLHMVLPEAYLGTDRQQRQAPVPVIRVQSAVAAMRSCLADGTLRELPDGFVLVRRSFENKSQQRCGLVVALDLERYDYSPDSVSLIRSSEGTIEQRLPARVAIRRQAELELPHIMVLIDDPQRSVIEPLMAASGGLQQVYDSRLAFDMGGVQGWHVPPEKAEAAREALSALLANLLQQSDSPMLFAMGDGNHSFAAAKAYWNELKPTLTTEQRENHPARYALCELVNIHDEGLQFEAIHRVVSGCHGMDGVYALADALAKLGSKPLLTREKVEGMQNIRYVVAGGSGYISIGDPPHMLEAGSVDLAIEQMLTNDDRLKVDYVHGDDAAAVLGRKEGMALLLPVIGKHELFPIVQKNGPLPRKAFSMGEADEKRCYLEARKIR